MYSVGKTSASSWGNIKKNEDKSAETLLREQRQKHNRNIDDKRRLLRGMQARTFDKEARQRRLHLDVQRETSNIDRKKRDNDQIYLDVTTMKSKLKLLETSLNTRLNDYKIEKDKFDLKETELAKINEELKRETELMNVTNRELKRLNNTIIR